MVQAANVVLFGFSNAARFDQAEALEVATVIGAVGVLMWSFSIAFALRDLAGRREREAALSAAVASGTPLAVVTVLWFWARSVGLG